MPAGKVSTGQVYRIQCGSDNCSFSDKDRESENRGIAIKLFRKWGWSLRKGRWTCFRCGEEEKAKKKVKPGFTVKPPIDLGDIRLDLIKPVEVKSYNPETPIVPLINFVRPPMLPCRCEINPELIGGFHIDNYHRTICNGCGGVRS